MVCKRPWADGVYTHVRPGCTLCTILLISAVYFRRYHGQEDQHIIQLIKKQNSAGIDSMRVKHGKCSEMAYLLQPWKYPGMPCHQLVLWFSASFLCLLIQTLAVSSFPDLGMNVYYKNKRCDNLSASDTTRRFATWLACHESCWAEILNNLFANRY